MSAETLYFDPELWDMEIAKGLLYRAKHPDVPQPKFVPSPSPIVYDDTGHRAGCACQGCIYRRLSRSGTPIAMGCE